MPRTRRRDVYRFQAHALRHALGKCNGGIPSRCRYDAELTRTLCPLCRQWFEFAELAEDHAPPRGGQSRLGGPHLVVLTCSTDNGSAGRSYEGGASVLSARSGPAQRCPVHSEFTRTSGGIYVSTSTEAQTLTDVKAAFLIAFATLGHRWALSPRLDRLAYALRAGDLTRARTDYEIVCLAGAPADVAAKEVVEIMAPTPAIVVAGEKAAVVLPAHGSPPAMQRIATSFPSKSCPPCTHTTRLRKWQWPRAHVLPGQGSPEDAWDETDRANSFHYDRCSSDHAAFATDLVLNAAAGRPAK